MLKKYQSGYMIKGDEIACIEKILQAIIILIK